MYRVLIYTWIMLFFQILSYIHQHKIQNGVDHMLVTLYEPILWRHTKVVLLVCFATPSYSVIIF